MTGRLTAMSGFLHGLFSSQSPGRSSPKAEEREDETMMVDSPQAGPSTITPGNSPYKLPVLADENKENDSSMYGVEFDTSNAVAGPSTGLLSARDTGRSITSSGFYGSPKNDRPPRSMQNSLKGKGRARDAPRAKAPRLAMDEVLQPVRTYKCPPADRPLYTLDKVNRTITIHATDADPSYWPTRTQQRIKIAATAPENAETATAPPTSEKKADWHEPVIKDTKQYVSWQQKCGQGLARLLDLEAPDTWTLPVWPKGYKMFIKHQYPNQNPANYTSFVYVIGSTFLGTRRFKTAKEYSKHLYWLCTFGDDVRTTCECRFCKRVFEKEGRTRSAIIQRVISAPFSAADVPPPKKRRKLIPTASDHDPNDDLASVSGGIQEQGSSSTTIVPELLSRVPALYASAATTSNIEESIPDEKTNPTRPSVQPLNNATREGRSSSSFANTAGEVFSRLFGLGSPSLPATTPVVPEVIPVAAEPSPQKKGRGRPNGSTAAAVAARTQPVVEIETVQMSQTVSAAVSEAMSADGSVFGRPRRSVPQPNYRIKTIAEVEAAEDLALAEAEATAVINASLNGANGRAIRSTRNPKSMKEVTPPPLRAPVGDVYPGPFIHRKRHDDLKIHSAPYREHEIVWYKLPQAHTCPENDRLIISHWPGEVVTKTLRIETHHVEIVEMEDAEGEKCYIPQPVNAQYYVYSIELMGVGKSTIIECRVDELLPWVAYAVPDILKGQYTSSLLTKFDSNLENLEQDQDFKHVLTTWVWARHWAITLQSQFSPFGFFLDNETSKKMRRRRGGYNNGSKKKNKKTRAERDAREKEMIRETELIASNLQYYQGVWFGCEKLWVGDMVRVAGTYERPSRRQEGDNTAHVQLFAGRTRKDGKGQFVRLEGYTADEESVGKPAFFQITHVNRLPGEDDSGGLLTFDGTFYELVKEEEDQWTADKRPPSLYGDMPGTLDISDSSSTDQDFIVDPVTGLKKLDCSVPSMYRRALMPPAPAGFAFKPLKRLPSLAEDEGASGVPACVIAGRYYESGVLFPDSDDVQSRKLVRACSGKAFRPETTMGPIHWTPNRRRMIHGSKRVALRAMNNFFAEKERKEAIARERQKKRDERKARGDMDVDDDDDDSDDGPKVSTSRSVQQTPPASDVHKKTQPLGSVSPAKQTTVTIDDSDADSDVVMVATTSSKRP